MFWSPPCGRGVAGTDLFSLLVEHGGHVQQGAALIQGGGKRLPLLLQLTRDLLDLLGGVVAGLHQAAGHGHDAVYVDVHVLRKGQEGGLIRRRQARGLLQETRTARAEVQPPDLGVGIFLEQSRLICDSIQICCPDFHKLYGLVSSSIF